MNRPTTNKLEMPPRPPWVATGVAIVGLVSCFAAIVDRVSATSIMLSVLVNALTIGAAVFLWHSYMKTYIAFRLKSCQTGLARSEVVEVTL